MRDRLLRLAHAVDAALLVAGIAYVIVFGWPTSVWGRVSWASAVAPMVTWLTWVAINRVLDRRAARRTMAYRREKFGGFVAVPRKDADGRRAVVPVGRPR